MQKHFSPYFLFILLTLMVPTAFGQAILTTLFANGFGPTDPPNQAKNFPQSAANIGAALPNPTIISTTIAGLNSQGVDYFGTDDALIADYGNGKIHHTKVSTATLVTTIDLTSKGYKGQGAIAITSDQQTILAHEEDRLFVIRAPFDASAVNRTSLLKLSGRMQVGQTRSMAIDPAGRAFVYHEKGIAVLDPPYTSVAFTLAPLPAALGTGTGFAGGGSLALTPDGQTLLATDLQTADVAIYSAPFSAASTYDTLTTPCSPGRPNVFQGLDGIVVAPDGRTALTVSHQRNGGICIISAPYNANSTVEHLLTQSQLNNLSFEDITVSADSGLAMACGNLSAFDALFIKAPFSANSNLSNVAISPKGRGAGSCRFLPPGLATGLKLTKTGPASVNSGDDISYTLTYGNTGGTAATGVALRDAVPMGTTYVSASPSPTSAPAVGSAGEVVWNLGTVPANTPNAGTITLTVNAAVSGGKIVNGGYRIADGAGVTVFGPPVETRIADRPPVAQADSYSVVSGATLTVDATQGVLANDSDPDHNVLGAIKVSDPTQGLLTLNADGAFTYDASGVPAGTYAFTYKASDGQLESSDATVTLVVTPANQPPHAAPDSYTTARDTLLAVSPAGLLRNDRDPDGNPLQIATLPARCSNDPNQSCTLDDDCGPQTGAPGDPYCDTPFDLTQPAHGTVAIAPDGRFTYVPDPGYSGSDSFTYKATDGQASSNGAVVKLRVNAVNDPPLPQNDQYQTVRNVALQIPAPGVLSNDTDPNGDLLQALFVTQPTHGVLQPTNDGGFIYTPNHNFIGLDSFQYQATDGALTSFNATVVINIADSGVNTPPIAQPDSYTVPFGAAKQTPAPGLLANDLDPDGNQPLRVVLDTDPGWQPQLGAVQLTGGGGFTYLPTATGKCTADQTDTFRYFANDGVEDSKKPAVVTLTIHCTNQRPLGQPDLYSTPRDTELVVPATGVLGNDSDPDGNPLRAVLETDTTQGALAIQPDGGFRYRPGLGFAGTDSFTYRVTDGGFTSAPVTVTITVNATNPAPVAVPTLNQWGLVFLTGLLGLFAWIARPPRGRRSHRA